MKIWLDDIRPMPPEFNFWAKTADQAISALKLGTVTEISLDHDLGDGDNGTGYEVAAWIEESAYFGTLPILKWSIHSANPIGRLKMISALTNADTFWEADIK